MTDLFEVMLHELCPEPMRKLPKVMALSWALRAAAQRLRGFVLKSMVNIDVDSLDIEVVDALAAEIAAPYYDDAADEETRRQTLKDAITNEIQSGTAIATERMISTVFGEGKTVEWFDGGLDPFYFEIETTAQFTPETEVDINRLLPTVKNARSVMASVTGVREVAADWRMGSGVSQSTREVLTETPAQHEWKDFIRMGNGLSQDSRDILTETPAQHTWETMAYAGGGISQDTLYVLL